MSWSDLLRDILSHSCLLWPVSKNTRLEGWKEDQLKVFLLIPPAIYPIVHAESKLVHTQEAGETAETNS